MKIYEGVEVYFHEFLTSALDGNDQLHAPDSLPPGKKAQSTHWIGGLMGSRAGLDKVAKRKIRDPTGNQTPVV
jgi:hypothetical protein